MRSILIHMGAGVHTVTVNDGEQEVVFDMNQMTKKQRSEFHREFMAAWRASQGVV